MDLKRKIEQVLADIRPLDPVASQKMRERLDSLTKPRGSLGLLEDLAVQLAGITGGTFLPNSKKKIVIMAADHGVTDEGVSAYPQEVTRQMVENFIQGGAAINVFSRLCGAGVRIVDIGMAGDAGIQGVSAVKVRRGTENFARKKAMSLEEVEKAIMIGVGIAREEVRGGVALLATGEMGIGNTTAASAVMAALTGYPPASVVGRGTGLDDKELQHKITIVQKALSLHKPNPSDPFDVLSKVGGLEIAGLVGLIIGAAAEKCPVIIDGFISSVAALTAVKLNRRVLNYLIPSHLSQEPGHGLLLEYLELKPYLHLNMRLGEGTGAVLAMALVEASARIPVEMATFDETGISCTEEKEKAYEDISNPSR